MVESNGRVGYAETHGPAPASIRTTVWLPGWIGKRLDAVLQDKEKRADVIRQGVLRELARREAEKKRPK